MSSVSSTYISNNHNLYFSKSELTKILNCYSIGVSNGNWKDYALNFNSNEAIFSIYKHSLALPDCILGKFREKKKKKITYYLFISNQSNKKKYENIDILIASLKRRQISVIKK